MLQPDNKIKLGKPKNTQHLTNAKPNSSKSGKLSDIKSAFDIITRANPEGSSHTGSGNGIDSFAVVDVQSLLCGNLCLGIDLLTNRQTQHIQKRNESTPESVKRN